MSTRHLVSVLDFLADRLSWCRDHYDKNNLTDAHLLLERRFSTPVVVIDERALPDRRTLCGSFPLVLARPALLGVLSRIRSSRAGVLVAFHWLRQQWFHIAGVVAPPKHLQDRITERWRSVSFAFTTAPASIFRSKNRRCRAFSRVPCRV